MIRMTERRKKKQSQLCVVAKIGTSSVVVASQLKENGPRVARLALVHLATVVEALCRLSEEGHNVVLVSSGAVASGCLEMNRAPPGDLAERQAMAAIGQVHLMAKYSALFATMGKKCAQVLLTYENFVDRVQFINARRTFEKLFEAGVIPVVNENDTVGTHELKADNDKLACMVGNLVSADLVFLMTDVNGVHTCNPLTYPDEAKRIPVVDNVEELRTMCKLSSGTAEDWGTGGMAAKISAAALATSLGVCTVIIHADDCHRIPAYVREEVEHRNSPGNGDKGAHSYDFGTTFRVGGMPPTEKKRWIRSLPRRGRDVVVDDGAAAAVRKSATLFARGVVNVRGNFSSYEAVAIVDQHGNEIACGLSLFSSDELREIARKSSDEIYDIIGRDGEVVPRTFLVVKSPSKSDSSKDLSHATDPATGNSERKNSFSSISTPMVGGSKENDIS